MCYRRIETTGARLPMVMVECFVDEAELGVEASQEEAFGEVWVSFAATSE